MRKGGRPRSQRGRTVRTRRRSWAVVAAEPWRTLRVWRLTVQAAQTLPAETWQEVGLRQTFSKMTRFDKVQVQNSMSPSRLMRRRGFQRYPIRLSRRRSPCGSRHESGERTVRKGSKPTPPHTVPDHHSCRGRTGDPRRIPGPNRRGRCGRPISCR